MGEAAREQSFQHTSFRGRARPVLVQHKRILFIVVLAISASVTTIAGWLYWASQQTPAFYAEALACSQTAAQQSSDRMLHQTAALLSDIRRPGQWQAIFTADQINGWLAYDVERNHPHLFPREVTDPRVAFENDRLMIAFRWRKPGWAAIVSLQAELYLQDINIIAVRIRNVRAGKLPLPIGSLLEEIAASGRELGLAVDQQLIEGDPLLLITLPASDNDTGKRMSLESLELHEGELYVAGQSGRTDDGPSPLAQRGRKPTPPPEAHVEKLNIQR